MDMDMGPSMMQVPRYLRWIKPISIVISAVITLAILFTFWTWLGPATFWQKVTGFLLSAAGGLVLFLFFQFIIMMLIGLIVAKRIQGKMQKGFQVAMEDSEEPEEPEEEMDEDDTMYG